MPLSDNQSANLHLSIPSVLESSAFPAARIVLKSEAAPDSGFSQGQGKTARAARALLALNPYPFPLCTSLVWIAARQTFPLALNIFLLFPTMFNVLNSNIPKARLARLATPACDRDTIQSLPCRL
jgi:hypothetical protein